MNLTRNGKIARLPKAVRDELNQRLANGVRGTELVAWLNGLPEVQCIIAEQFGGKPVRAQNLSEWKQGGYQDWLNKQEAMEAVRQLPAGATALQGPDGEPFSEIVGTWLTARYAVIANGLQKNGELDWKRLRKLCQDVSVLRRADHSAARLKLEREKLEHARKQTKEEMVAQFVRWVKDPRMQELLRKHLNAEQHRGEPQMGTDKREVSQRVNEPVGHALGAPVRSSGFNVQSCRGHIEFSRTLYEKEVAPTGSRPYRPLAIGESVADFESADYQSATQQVANLRYSSLASPLREKPTRNHKLETSNARRQIRLNPTFEVFETLADVAGARCSEAVPGCGLEHRLGACRHSGFRLAARRRPNSQARTPALRECERIRLNPAFELCRHRNVDARNKEPRMKHGFSRIRGKVSQRVSESVGQKSKHPMEKLVGR